MLSHFSHVWPFVTPWTVARQGRLPVGFSSKEHWTGLPCPPPGDLPEPGIKPGSLTSPVLAGELFTTSTTWEALELGGLTDIYLSRWVLGDLLDWFFVETLLPIRVRGTHDRRVLRRGLHFWEVSLEVSSRAISLGGSTSQQQCCPWLYCTSKWLWNVDSFHSPYPQESSSS